MINTNAISKERTHGGERGIALLIALLLMSVLLGVSASLLNVTLKQYQLSGIARDSEMAFQAASAGIECIGYLDNPPDQGLSPFAVKDDGTEQVSIPTITCFGLDAHQAEPVDTDTNNGNTAGNRKMASGDEQRFQFSWGSPNVCTDVSVYKFLRTGQQSDMSGALGQSGTCPAGVECTVVRSRGYNMPCGTYTKNTVEREITQRY